MNKASLKDILDVLQIPSNEQIRILLKLNEALGYSLYKRYFDKFEDHDKEKLKKLLEKTKTTELIEFIKERTNKKELQKIVSEENESIIKEFLEEYLKGINSKKREETLNQLTNYFSSE